MKSRTVMRKMFIVLSVAFASIICLFLGMSFRDPLINPLPFSMQRFIHGKQERDVNQLGKIKKRLNGWHEKLSNDPYARTSIWYDYAQYAKARSFYGEAVLAYRYILSHKPNDSYALQRLAALHVDTKSRYAHDPYEAFRLIAKVEKQHTPQKGGFYELTPRIYTTYAEALYQLEQYEDAVHAMQKAIRYTINRHYVEVESQTSQVGKYILALKAESTQP